MALDTHDVTLFCFLIILFHLDSHCILILWRKRPTLQPCLLIVGGVDPVGGKLVPSLLRIQNFSVAVHVVRVCHFLQGLIGIAIILLLILIIHILRLHELMSLWGVWVEGFNKDERWFLDLSFMPALGHNNIGLWGALSILFGIL